MSNTKKQAAPEPVDPLTIPSFLSRKAWDSKQRARHAFLMATTPVTQLEQQKGSFKERREYEAIATAVEQALRRMPTEQQEVTAREVLPLFGHGMALDELRLMVDDRMPGVLKDEEEADDRLRGSARERVAQEVSAAVGGDALTLHELRKRLPGMETKVLRSGLRRALATSMLFQRKDGGRFVYSTAAGRKAAAAVEATPGQPARKPRGGSGASKGAKAQAIGALLTRAEGCTTEDILKLTGWPSVSVPAQAKSVGLTLRKEKLPGQPTRYYGTKE